MSPSEGADALEGALGDPATNASFSFYLLPCVQPNTNPFTGLSH